MSLVKRIVLDVLKPHQPSILEFADTIANQCDNSRVKITVVEVDEKTETIIIYIDGNDIAYSTVEKTIIALGGSVHSIDEVDVSSVSTSEV